MVGETSRCPGSYAAQRTPPGRAARSPVAVEVRGRARSHRDLFHHGHQLQAYRSYTSAPQVHSRKKLDLVCRQLYDIVRTIDCWIYEETN